MQWSPSNPRPDSDPPDGIGGLPVVTPESSNLLATSKASSTVEASESNEALDEPWRSKGAKAGTVSPPLQGTEAGWSPPQLSSRTHAKPADLAPQASADTAPPPKRWLSPQALGAVWGPTAGGRGIPPGPFRAAAASSAMELAPPIAASVRRRAIKCS
mmetsp:Transcript_109945/g.355017  ORF Transcript_109945/g.355017 Transcript_109945/m.355017 type:complete len:158 (+) Transcript_109945:277-750(+)